jgi:hypothetical protein
MAPHNQWPKVNQWSVPEKLLGLYGRSSWPPLLAR